MKSCAVRGPVKKLAVLRYSCTTRMGLLCSEVKLGHLVSNNEMKFNVLLIKRVLVDEIIEENLDKGRV